MAVDLKVLGQAAWVLAHGEYREYAAEILSAIEEIKIHRPQNVGENVGRLMRLPQETGEIWIERMRQHFAEEAMAKTRCFAERFADADRQP